MQTLPVHVGCQPHDQTQSVALLRSVTVGISDFWGGGARHRSPRPRHNRARTCGGTTHMHRRVAHMPTTMPQPCIDVHKHTCAYTQACTRAFLSLSVVQRRFTPVRRAKQTHEQSTSKSTHVHQHDRERTYMLAGVT